MVTSAMPRKVKKVFKKWIKENGFELDGNIWRGQTLDNAIELILDRSGFDCFGEYQMQVNRKNQNFGYPKIEITDENGISYILKLGNNGWPGVSVTKQDGESLINETFVFNKKFNLSSRHLSCRDEVNSIDIRQTPKFYGITFGTGDTKIFINTVCKHEILYGSTIDEVMDFMLKTVNKPSDFLELCSELANFSLFDATEELIISKNISDNKNESVFVMRDGELKKLILTNDNHRIEYNGDKSTWKLETDDNFVVSKKEIDNNSFQRSCPNNELSNNDLKNNLNQDEKIEMCEQEITEVVHSFQKILVRNEGL